MGTSTDAKLAFGIDLGDELPEKMKAYLDEEGDECFDWGEFLSSLSDLQEPIGNDYQAPEWSAYWDKQSAFVKAFPLRMETHCSGDYPMYFLCINGTHIVASRGETVAVSTPDVSPEKIAIMREFCDKYGIEWQEPTWQIFSLWM